MYDEKTRQRYRQMLAERNARRDLATAALTTDTDEDDE